uniref:Polyprotein n=3 Tax=Cucurbit yellow stunting disorder virus TaxID=51330 RepID=Q70UT1_9CLOS|nr:polyprotein [Cucurbit yellow stunting disorder virus]
MSSSLVAADNQTNVALTSTVNVKGSFYQHHNLHKHGNKTNKAIKRVNKTEQDSNKRDELFAGRVAVSPKTFRNRLVAPGLNPHDVIILSNGNAQLIPIKKSFVKNRLNILRSICSIPSCNFNKMPKPVIYKFGYDVDRINRAIDSYISSKVGTTNEKPRAPTEIIRGVTKYGDGYRLSHYEETGTTKISVCFDRLVKGKYMFEITLTEKFNKSKVFEDFRVEAKKLYANTTGQSYCQPFDLHGRANPLQYHVKVVLASVLQKIPDYQYYFGTYFGNKYAKTIKSCKHLVYVSCYNFFQFCISKVGVNASARPVRLVDKGNLKTHFAKIDLKIDLNGREYFVVTNVRGEVYNIPNDRQAIRNMYNATLDNGKYVIHGECITPYGTRYKSHPSQYCWIKISSRAKIAMPRELIPFPELNYGFLVSCGLGQTMQGRLKTTGPGLLHYDGNLHGGKQVIRYGSKVGVRIEAESDHLIKNIEILFDELCTGVVSTSTLRGDNPLMNNLTNRMSDMINKQCAKNKDIVISTCLNNRQKRELTELFPEINYEFQDSSYSSHPLATAMRHTENFLLARSCNNRQFIEAGGNVVYHLKKMVKDVHVCSPVVDVKDAHRHMTRSLQLDKMKGIDERVTMCCNLVQDCDVVYPNIISVQVYDMTLQDMARALVSHKAKRYDFSMIIPPEIYDDNCDVLLFDDSVRVRVIDNKVKYEYGDSGEAYYHDRENLKNILATQIFEVDGIIYKKTLENSRKQLHFYSLVACVDMPTGIYRLETHYNRSETDKLQIRVPVEGYDKQVTMEIIKVEKSNYHHMIEYAMNTVLKLDEKAYEYLLSQYRARKSVSIRGGKVTQITCDMNPKAVAGFIGALAGCALRLREQAHRSAKLAYLDFYAPSLLRYIAKVICVILKRVNNWTKKYFESVLKFLTPESVLEQVNSESCGVYAQEGEYNFVQTVNVINEGKRKNVLSESIQKFKKFEEKMVDNLENKTAEHQQFFNPDMQDVMNDIFNLGGGSASPTPSLELMYITSYRFYQRIYEVLSWFCKDNKKCGKFCNFICAICGGTERERTVDLFYILNLVMDVINFLKSGVNKLPGQIGLRFKRIFELVSNKFSSTNRSFEEKLDKLLKEEEHMYVLRDTSKISETYHLETDEEDVDLNALFDLASIGGGSKYFRFYTLNLKSVFPRFKKFLYHLNRLKYKCCSIIEKFLNMCKVGGTRVKEFCKFYFDLIFEEDGLNYIIKNVSFNAVNIFVALMVGDVSIFRTLISSIYYAYMSCYGRESKLIGGESMSRSIGFMLMTPSLPGIITLPIKLAAELNLGSSIKLYFSDKERFKPAATNLIAKDVLLKDQVVKLTSMTTQRLCSISLILMLIDIKWGLSFIITFYLLTSFTRYVKSICVGANILISYGKELDRLNPTMKYRKLKKLFVERFDKSRFLKPNNKPEDESEDFSDRAEICRVGNEQCNSDVEVELDHKGKVVYDKSRDLSILSNFQSDCAEDRVDGLNFSLLNPTLDRTQIECNVSFSLSHALLIFPKSDGLDFVQTGNDLLDSVKEFYHLEAKKLHDEMGRLNGAIRKYYELNLETKSVRDAIWHLRNYLDDSSLYAMLDSRSWYRLGKKDHGFTTLEAECKYTHENELVDFDTVKSGVQICSDELIGMFANKRCIALESVIRTKTDNIASIRNKDVIFYNKPPGAGKTTEIVNNLIEDLKNKKISVALTHTSNGKREIVQKLRSRGVSGASKLAFTYDSILMKNEVNKIDKLYCDEIFMVHSGEWLSVCALYDCNTIRCYGDRNQIPFINRVANTICRYHKDIYLTFKTIDDNISYRCPVDVCYLLSNLKDDTGNLLYPNGVYPVGDNRNVLRSMEVEPITSVDTYGFDGNGKNISFTRPEREEIDQAIQKARLTGMCVNTVHEVQGGTFPHVYLYRLRKYDNPIYENINQFVVSISRHTKCLRYRVITDKMFDKIGERVSAINSVQDYVIKEHMFKQMFSIYNLNLDFVKTFKGFSRPPASHFFAINEFMSLVNPNLSAYEYIHRTLLFEYHDFEMPYLEDVDIKLNKTKIYQPGEYIVSNLLGKGERSRPDTWKQALISLSKRNFSAPRVNEKLDVLKTAERLSHSLFKAFDFTKLFENYDPVLPDLNKLGEWLTTRDGMRYGKLKRSMNHRLVVEQFQPLNFMIKGDMKPKMDMSSYSQYDPPSNIIYYKNCINLFYSPLFLEIFDRIVYCLKGKIIMYSGMNLMTLADLIGSTLPMPVEAYHTTEIDFRMFDKSQGVLFKVYEEIIYKVFKFSEEMYDNIKLTEYFTRYTGTCGVSGELGAQRRTGSPNTWLSNTLVTMGILLSQYNLDDIDLMLVSGDDSLIFSKKPLPNVTAEINKDFGFEAKFLMNSVPYFCSKYIFTDDGKVRVVPDAQRMFEKLSNPIRRSDFEEGTILKERFISYKDLMYYYRFDTTCLAVDRLICKRHGLPEMSSYAALCYIHCMFANVVAFRKLFDERFSVNI